MRQKRPSTPRRPRFRRSQPRSAHRRYCTARISARFCKLRPRPGAPRRTAWSRGQRGWRGLGPAVWCGRVGPPPVPRHEPFTSKADKRGDWTGRAGPGRDRSTTSEAGYQYARGGQGCRSPPSMHSCCSPQQRGMHEALDGGALRTPRGPAPPRRGMLPQRPPVARPRRPPRG